MKKTELVFKVLKTSHRQKEPGESSPNWEANLMREIRTCEMSSSDPVALLMLFRAARFAMVLTLIMLIAVPLTGFSPNEMVLSCFHDPLEYATFFFEP